MIAAAGLRQRDRSGPRRAARWCTCSSSSSSRSGSEMSWQAILAGARLVVALGICVPLLGRYMAKVYGGGRRRPATGSSARSSGSIYRVCGIDPKREQRWNVYALSLLAFSLRVGPARRTPSSACRASLPLNPTDRDAVDAVGAVEHRRQLRDQHQLADLLRRGDDEPPHPDGRPGGPELRVGRRSGMAVAVALIRGLIRAGTATLGNFWVDLVRTWSRILLPLALVVHRRPRCARASSRTSTASPRRPLDRSTDADGTGRRHPGDPRRPGRQPGGDQGARHERRRLLQRQLGPPVREPQRRSPTCSRSARCC